MFHDVCDLLKSPVSNGKPAASASYNLLGALNRAVGFSGSDVVHHVASTRIVSDLLAGNEPTNRTRGLAATRYALPYL